MERDELKRAIDIFLFMSTQPITVNEIKNLLDKQTLLVEPANPAVISAEDQLKKKQVEMSEQLTTGDIRAVLQEIISELNENPCRGIELVEVAKGFQLRTKPIMKDLAKLLSKIPKARFSAPSMETLAIIAYQQPIARVKVEEIRGVDSGGVLKTLLDRDLIRIVGRSEEPGKPILYGTSRTFLEMFGLNALSDLPSLKDLQELDLQMGTQASFEAEEVQEEAEAFAEIEALPDETSTELLDELENSMRHIRDVEKDLFPSPQSPPLLGGEEPKAGG